MRFNVIIILLYSILFSCKNEERLTKQVQPTINLLTHMDELHPDVLLQHEIQPADYHKGLVFRSAIESIRGTFIASSTTGREDKIGLGTAPDVFLFPQRIPSLEDPEPPVHMLDTLRLPGLILELFGVDASAQDRHIWEVHVKVVELPNERVRREVQVWHQGKVVGESRSRPWRP